MLGERQSAAGGRRASWAAVLVSLWALVPPVGAGAETTRPQRTRQEELAVLRVEIGRMESELSRLEAEHEVVGRERARVELELELQGARWREAEQSRFLAEQALVATEAQVERLRGTVAAAEARLRSRLQSLYRMGRNGDLRLLLSIGSRDGLLPGARTLRYLARRDANDLARFREAERQLAAEVAALESRRAEEARWEALEAQRWQRLLELEQDIGRRLAGLERRRATRATERDRLATRAARLDDLVDYLAGTPGIPFAARPMTEYEGTLDWPVSGTVVVGFGPVLDRRYGTQLPHDGVEIAVEGTAPVVSVYPGEVLFAAPLEGYGPTVVVRHPGRIFSLYAGLDEVRAERGAVLSLADPIGVISGRLYFEIRVGNRPVDPSPWFR